MQTAVQPLTNPILSSPATAKHKRIAFCGFAGVGKDEAATPLIVAGYSRCCFGDIIKKQVDSMVQKHLGFSAFTDDRAEKQKIRRTLEGWGEDNYDAILREFFSTLPIHAVNTRLCRLAEAVEWQKSGGKIVLIERSGVFAETEWSARIVEDLQREGFIDHTIVNDGTLWELYRAVTDYAMP